MPSEGGKQETLRPEAAPLRPDQLTEAQKSAGERATRLLHEMAQQPWKKRAPKPPGLEFLPTLDEQRGNRIILIDGARGSGKSALLLTVIKSYSQLLLPEREEVTLPGVDPEDMIVPVGLIDLQPLPPSTNLLLLLTTALEKVVQALTPEPRTPGVPRWHEAEEEELPSRRAWRIFSRVAASSWQSNLPERKGALDPEAFAVEAENEEYRRLDLSLVFGDFLDALVADYKTRRRWNRAPLFLLAIDDADMNPQLSGALLELLRKLYHGRLAFLITGDSDLFVQMLEVEISRASQTPAAVLSRLAQGTAAGPASNNLASEMYAKVVPVNARCALPPLPRDERLAAVPGLEVRLRKLVLDPHEGLAGEEPLTLADYLSRGGPLAEVLPDRLRHLWDVHGVLANIEAEEKVIPALHAVKALWDLAVEADSAVPEAHRVKRLLRVEGKKWLRIEPELQITPELQQLDVVSRGGALQLVLERPDAFEASIVSGGKTVRLASRTSAAWMLAASVAADDTRGMFTRNPLSVDGLTQPLFAHCEGDLPNVGRLQAAWPIPDWTSFEDLLQFDLRWRSAVLGIRLPRQGDIPDKAARRFLDTVVRVGLSRRWVVEPKEGHPGSEWGTLTGELYKASRVEGRTRRISALRHWARSRAGLLAAPESGLPPASAVEFLQALKIAFGADWELVKSSLRRARRERLQVEGTDVFGQRVTVESAIAQLDEVFPGHPFREMVEDQPGVVRSKQNELAGTLSDTLRSIRVPWLSRIVHEHVASLESYISKYRSDWLRETPAPVLQRMRDALEPTLKLGGTGAPPISALWRAAVSGNPSLETSVRIEGGKLRLDERVLLALQGVFDRPVAGEVEFAVGAGTDFEATILAPRAFSSPVLAPPGVDAAEAVLRLAYDYSLDDSGRSGALRGVRSIWHGAQFNFRGQRYSPWLFPPWPTLVEWEHLELTWKRVSAHAAEASNPADKVLQSPALDALANWLMTAAQLLSIRQQPPDTLAFSISDTDWTRLTRRFWEVKQPVHQTHELGYSHWLERVPLMAAPECGLTVDAAAALLSSFTADFAEPESPERVRMGVLRYSRIIEAGIPEGHADTFLSQMDAAHPAHPWVQLFGPWTARETVPQPRRRTPKPPKKKS
ncbi:MAG TPA: hypothetical protein VK447_00650 [Myxococcaceae bacterium]|nr:hypothetical protein [Myxococcaceae bacterium]